MHIRTHRRHTPGNAYPYAHVSPHTHNPVTPSPQSSEPLPVSPLSLPLPVWWHPPQCCLSQRTGWPWARRGLHLLPWGGTAFHCHPFLSPSSLQTSRVWGQQPSPGEGSCHTGSPGAELGGWAMCPQGYARPIRLGFSQSRRLCGPQAPHWEGPPGEWSLAGCRGSGDPHGWHPSGGPGTDLGLTKLVGEGYHPNLTTTRQPSLVGSKPPGPALSNILKPLVKGRSISHVPLAGGIKSSERTLVIHHQLVGTGVPEQ